MKRQLFALAIFAALTCSGLRAQTLTATAKVPFDFVVGGKALPAGDYHISCNNGLLLVRNAASGHGAMAIARPAADEKSGRVTPSKGLLRFNRYGDEHFLSAVWAPNGSETGAALPQTARQKELAKRY